MTWLLVALAALGLWLALRDTATEPRSAAAPGRAYSLYGVETLSLDENGQPLYRIQAASMHRRPGRAEVELRELRLQALQPEGPAWRLNAPSAFMNEQKRTMLLAGPVEMFYPLGQETAYIETEDVQLQPDGRTAWSERPTRISWGGLSLSSLGFKADARSARLELSSQVRGHLLPPAAGAALPGGTPGGPVTFD